MVLIQLFFEFAKAGLFAVGGGLATLPFLYDISDRTGWFTHADLMDMLAVSESTPGPIGVNTATYAGFQTAGIPGALIATLGLIFPSVVIILIVARILQRFKENRTVKSVFYGLRPASTALIAAAGFGVVKVALFNIPAFQTDGFPALFRLPNIAMALILFFLMKRFPKHPAFYIALSAAAGAVLFLN